MDKRLLFFRVVLRLSLLSRGWLGEIGYVASLPVIDYRSTDIVDISLSAFLQFACALGDLSDKVLRVSPRMHTEDVCDVLGRHTIQNGLDVRLGIRQTLSSHHSLEDFICVSLTLVIDNSWAIDEIDALCKGDILPDFSLSRDGRNFAAILFHERIDHG